MSPCPSRYEVRRALSTLVTRDQWYAWLWGEDTPPDRGHPNQRSGKGTHHAS